MKRFWKEVSFAPCGEDWQVMLDGRPLRTQGGAPQLVPTAALAQLLAAEWRGQGDKIDPRGFTMRDMADFAIDKVQADRAATISRLLSFAETDTLCYRAQPEDPLFRHQLTLWEPLLETLEAKLGVQFERVNGIAHRAQPVATLAALRGVLEAEDEFTLASLHALASLAASLVVALAAIAPEADPVALFAASNAEEDWQAEKWGWEQEAERVRGLRLDAFKAAATFLKALPC